MSDDRNYLVQPELGGERKADYKKGELINKKWHPVSPQDAHKICPDGTCGNVHGQIQVSKKTKKIKFVEGYSRSADTVGLYESISAALALYRVICMINNPIVVTEGASGYKVPWNVYLVHIETGEILSFGEWKGAFGIWTRFHDHKQLPEAYKKDVEEILNLMLSDRSPHPYDNCTAGIVA
ncbi:MAG TPA: hypothetical protein VNX68_02855 [Nitrosopumilaceae archaeon]|jgi:hypothetical protein|nr:hypothetical protein [Nitrosopumilaceae archaeon]